MKKVLLIIAQDGFQPDEYGKPKEILEKGGIEVVTASNNQGTAVSAITDTEVQVDISIDKVDVTDYSGIFLIGGPGAIKYLNNEIVYKIIRGASMKCDVFGAICVSPRILAKSGILSGKKATGWNNDDKLEEIYKEAGVVYTKQPVVQDGTLITAWGPDAAEEFGKTILKNL